ncbi:MAG: Carbon monoxide dehydrogenase 1 [Actinobacteria bacterium]|nr:Carbon monoxide dehydrogenase 1 [Actinomycetota bacterium]
MDKIKSAAEHKENILKSSPNTAVKQIKEGLDSSHIPTLFDRFEKQLPQCNFGLTGLCCRMCNWGPCKITPTADRGTCGKDADAVVIGNHLRAMVAGLSAHAIHAHEAIMSVISASDGMLNFPLKGAERIYELAERLGILSDGKNLQGLARDAANVMLSDLSNMHSEPMKMLNAFAPTERKKLWKEFDIIPRSVSYEVMESLHMTTLGSCSDWNALAKQELRAALAYCYGTLFTSSFATEMLFGLPAPQECETGYGVLKKYNVNILLHGHSPVMAEKIIEKMDSPEALEMAKMAGAEGIMIAGMCCTGQEMLARHGIPSLANISGQEFAVGTGAFDALVVDMQCVIQGIKTIADCFKTEVITTCNSNRIPGATHIPFDAEDSHNIDEKALLIIRKAVEAFKKRDRKEINIPEFVNKAIVGWSYESIVSAFGGIKEIARLLKNGGIRGIATVVGCTNPKVAYEFNHLTTAERLIKEDILIISTGCAGHAFLNSGICSLDEVESVGDALQLICREKAIPPVMISGGCVDNARAIRLFIDIAEGMGMSIKDMPFMFVSPEPGNEKSFGQSLSFLLHGVSVCTGIPAPVPFTDRENNIIKFFSGDESWSIQAMLGARIYTKRDPFEAAETIIEHIGRKRTALGWK